MVPTGLHGAYRLAAGRECRIAELAVIRSSRASSSATATIPTSTGNEWLLPSVCARTASMPSAAST
jgi:hypothetical protein